MDKILELFVAGNSPNEWLILKIIVAIFGGFSAYYYKYYFSNSNETKIKFWWKGFWFTIISALGGVFLLGPQTATNAYLAGLLGWSSIAGVIKQKNEGASDENFTEGTLTPEQMKSMMGKEGERGE